MSKIEEIDIDTDEQYTSGSTSSGGEYDDIYDEYKDEKLTTTIINQIELSKSVQDKHKQNGYDETLKSQKIIKFLKRSLEGVNSSHQALDSSKVWIAFWALNGLDLLGNLDSMQDVSERTASYFTVLQNSDGGFGGGNTHTSHSVSTFAAVSALFSVGTEQVYNVINRETMYQYLLRMKTQEGAFRTEIGGEVDSRSTYCAIAVASMLNILTDELKSGVAEFLERCQTYEGGFGAYPGNEAHGGYTFCAVSALAILNKLDIIDMESLHRWITFRQTEDGGFQGRTNKLVDTCYSYWQGAVVVIIQSFYDYQCHTDISGQQTPIDNGKLLFSQRSLQEYILICCQDKAGGFGDHPVKGRDYYHTSYGLSGLSLSQHNDIYKIIKTMNNEQIEQAVPPITLQSDVFKFNDQGDVVEPTHPLYNIKITKLEKGLKYFHSLPFPPK
ncbi:protein farnesyltransferase beta subunit [Tieghemostelium lacteum]|uniref:Protein farnesyltransferase subunit beta n=1 Tax=Tieghemostelium lacteum TaxID=361077 RepID=A0A151Z5R6_TIELA|nr:protein farnesyltransferase beta subunit [Tieghemostelium lacteum]|eukprot:KYQ89144.1 protein farnesyltransferase beta subunit [Tieghemostelium lacteum]